jgi:cation:H+ antiporter
LSWLDSLPLAVAVLLGAGAVLVTVGVQFTKVVDELADRTGIGEALAGALLLGAATSLPGLMTTITGAASGRAGFAISNAVGGIAAQTTFLVIADLVYRRVNLEHAAASLTNLTHTITLLTLIGIVIAAIGGPDHTLGWIHPATIALVVVYGYGLVLARRVSEAPMWTPRRTRETVIDEEQPDATSDRTLAGLWGRFAAMAAVVGVVGFLVGRAGISIAQGTGLSGSLVGGLFTSVVTSLPELVTVLTAVRIGALTLAVSDIVGGNTFDVLFIAAADMAFTGGSVYHAADPSALFLLAVTVVLTALLAGGLVTRERRHIGFEGFAILGFYGIAVVSLFVLG